MLCPERTVKNWFLIFLDILFDFHLPCVTSDFVISFFKPNLFVFHLNRAEQQQVNDQKYFCLWFDVLWENSEDSDALYNMDKIGNQQKLSTTAWELCEMSYNLYAPSVPTTTKKHKYNF